MMKNKVTQRHTETYFAGRIVSEGGERKYADDEITI